MESTVDVGKGKQAVSCAVLEPLTQRLVVDDSRDEGRIALGHVVLWLAPFVRVLLGDGREERIALAERRGAGGEGRDELGRVEATGIAAALTRIRRRLGLVRVLLYASLCALGSRGCAVDGGRKRADVQVEQSESRAGGRGLGCRREGIRVGYRGLGGVRRRGREVQIFLQHVQP